MKNYELTYLIPANIADEEKKQISEHLSSLIQDKGGVLKESGLPIKKTLPQAIKNLVEVFSVSINFFISPDKIQEIEAGLKEEKTILRSIIVIKKILSAPKPIRKRIKESPQKKVDLKNIEEKIDEILKEE